MGYDLINGDWRRCDEDDSYRPCKKCVLAEALCDEDYCAKCLNNIALALIDEQEGKEADEAYERMQAAANVLLPPITVRPVDPIALDKAAQKLANAIVALVKAEMS